jgi:hypothetical protein
MFFQQHRLFSSVPTLDYQYSALFWEADFGSTGTDQTKVRSFRDSKGAVEGRGRSQWRRGG